MDKSLLRGGITGWAALALLLLGCATPDEQYFRDVHSRANVYVAPVPAAIHKVAIMPFKSPTELIGLSVSDLFVTEMLRAGRYELVERSQMAKVLSESELSLAGLSATKAAEVGNMIGADGVIIGTVDEYATVAQRGHPYPVVAISVRLIDCASGKVLWSADLARRADTKEITLPEQARRVAHELMAGLYQRWGVQKKIARPAVRAAAPAPPDQPVGRTTPAGITVNSGPPAVERRPVSGLALSSGLPAAAAPAAAPADFKVSDMGVREARLTWAKPASSSLKVRVERARSAQGPFEVLATLAASRREYCDRGLQDSATYYYRLTVVAAGSVAGASTPVRESLTATPPAAVTGLAARSGEVRAVPLSWQPSPEPDVARYNVYWSSKREGAFALLASVPGRTAGSLVDDGKKSDRLGDAQTRYYKVRAVNAAGAESADSTAVSATTHGAPPAVQGLRAQSGLPRATRLVWEPSSDPTTTGYELQRSSRKADDFAELAKLSGRNATNFIDRGDAKVGTGLGTLQDGTVYSYRVRALNVTEYPSPWAAPAAAQTKSLPPAAGKIQAAYGSGEVQLTWPATSVGERVRYRIWKKGERDPLGVTEQNSCVLRYGDVGRRAAISVTVVDADGLESPPGAAIELDECAPPTPQGLTAGREGLREVVLRWKPPADNARDYRIERSDVPEGLFAPVAKVAPDAGTYRDAGAVAAPLADATTYFYRLVALAANNRESSPGAVVQADTAPPPAPPAAVKAEAPAPRTVRVSWSASPAEGVVKYLVERAAPEAPEKFARVGEVPELVFSEGGDTKTGLRDSSEYLYRVIAINRVGSCGAPSQPAAVTTQPPPAPPVAVKAEAPASRALRVAWTPSVSPWVVKYIVERASADQPENFSRVGEVDQPAFSEGGTAKTDLQDSTKYLYRIAAVNRLGAAGAPSQPVEVVTRPPPAAVQGLTAGSGNVRCVPLAWKASPERDVVRYDLFRRDAPDGPWKLLTALPGREKTAWLDGGADPGKLADQQVYAYKLRAINAVTAESADSEAVEATTRGAPPVVAGVRVKAGQPREAAVAWEASPDEKVRGYEVYRWAAAETNAVKIAELSGRERTSYSDRGAAGQSGLGTLADGAEYRYQLAAFNTAHVCSPLSEPVAARTKPAPAAPAAPDVTTNLPKAVKSAWLANPEPDIRVYVLEAARGADEKFREVARVEATAGDRLSHTEAGLPDGARRWYRVKAVDRDTLESPWSPVAPGATKALPAAPAELRAEWKNDAAVLTWAASASPDVRSYKLWKKGVFGSEVLATVTGTEGRLSGAQVPKKIKVAVSAVDADGLESEPSSAVEVTPPVAGPAAVNK